MNKLKRDEPAVPAATADAGRRALLREIRDSLKNRAITEVNAAIVRQLESPRRKPTAHFSFVRQTELCRRRLVPDRFRPWPSGTRAVKMAAWLQLQRVFHLHFCAFIDG